MMQNSNCFENRELSWLRFNERVLEEAEDERVPLCERLTFLSIFQSNLDEFFMVRIGSLFDQSLIDSESRDNKTYMTCDEQIKAAIDRIRVLCKRKDRCYADLQGKLNEQGISIVNFRNISPSSEQELLRQFKKNYLPFLSAFFFSKKQAFPFLKNKDIYAVAVLMTKQGKQRTAIIPCSGNVFPRLIPIPDRKGCFILAEELILHFLPVMFKDSKVISKTLARITRNADIDADSIYDEDLNYRDHMAEVIKMRQKLCPVRLELSRQIGHDVLSMLCEQLELTDDRVFNYETPLDLSFLFMLSDELRNHSELFYAPRYPQACPELPENMSVLDRVREKDVLLHYPYQSIRPFLRLLNESAHDPRVTSIYMTLYRLARDSKVIESLVEAAENGKNVEVFVELKARFDEENNIEWSRRLEQAGCKVIYGIEHIKVHSKLCHIRLKDPNGKRWSITQIGTGNYNEKTSRMYTDLSIMTSNADIGAEAEQVFDALRNGGTIDHASRLLVSPHCMQNKLIDLIDHEIAKAKEGKPAHIRVKTNSLSDKTLIMKLITASQAGVKIEMVVRGICCLIPGVPGKTENIRIISIVGRYLEHSRIYIFGDGDEADYYISSADWMTRNMLRRVEIACPIYDKSIKNRLESIFNTMWADNMQAREQQPDGTYVRRRPGNKAVNAQNAFYEEAYMAAKEE